MPTIVCHPYPKHAPVPDSPIPTLAAPLPNAPVTNASLRRSAEWKLDEELVEELAKTSFRKALELAEGTVSILDSGGKVFTRIWCTCSCSSDSGHKMHRSCSLVTAPVPHLWQACTKSLSP